MSVKILANTIVGLEQFCQEPLQVLQQAEQGMLAVFSDNAPVMYALSAERLAELLACEQRAHQQMDVSLDQHWFNNALPTPVAIPAGKFRLYADWQPDTDFIRQAALWGIGLKQPVQPTELAAFITYWQAEGKVFHHVQWQQKLARHLQLSRRAMPGVAQQDFTQVEAPDQIIPKGFRG